MRARAKAHLPTVLLTLLSIVQALALEQLWSHASETEHLYAFDLAALTGWGQVAATLLGIVLIWIVYASNVVRFRWVPTTSDSVYPFYVGALEMAMVEALHREAIGVWFIVIGVIFASMTLISHFTLRRARRDGENEEWFASRAPARLRDFYQSIIIVSVVVAIGAVFTLASPSPALALSAVVVLNAFLVWQFYVTAQFWKMSVLVPDETADSDQAPPES
jgi:hypothetical protein